ncbi:MAG: polysaccharide pyruvyl transferase family protein [Anderseniella sp.]|jgi:polysaccharide pyruvyl transferase WcaK-like protein|nr:polysaccharide pyruvyl transferase family protein [Anderseniella sp.]
MNKPVAILFANLKGNIGDFAILEVILRDVYNLYPKSEIHVFSHGFTTIDSIRLKAFRESGAPDFDLAGTTYKANVPLLLRKLHRRILKTGLWPTIQGSLTLWEAAVSSNDAKRFSLYEAIFLAGGDQWNGFDSGISMFGTLKSISKYNRNIFAYPFSMNPEVFKFNFSWSLNSYFNKISSPIIVRDSISKDQFARLGRSVTLGTDCVYSLQDISQEIAPHPDRDSTRTLISLARGLEPNWSSIMATTLMRLKSEMGSLELLTTCGQEDLDVYERLGAEFNIPVRAPLTWQEAVAEFKNSALIVTNRLHALILGSFTDRPLLPVADRKKAEAFCNDTGVPFHAEAIKDLTPTLLARVKQDEAAIIMKVATYREKTRQMPLRPIALQT